MKLIQLLIFFQSINNINSESIIESDETENKYYGFFIFISIVFFSKFLGVVCIVRSAGFLFYIRII
jgi:hypothetical protein